MFKILVVTDDIELGSDVVEMLNLESYEAILASSGQDALNSMKNFQANLIISEITMPIMTGYDLLSTLRSNPDTEKIPMIFMVRKKDMESIDNMLIAPDDYLILPFLANDLLISIRNFYKPKIDYSKLNFDAKILPSSD